MKLFVALLAAPLLAAQMASAASYKLDPAHSEIIFSVKHLMVSTVSGNFKKFDGSFDYDPAKKELKNLVVNIDTSSVDTRETKRDDHLKTEDFFASQKFPKMTFKGEKAEFDKDGKSAKVHGMLTIRDKTKPITLDVKEIGEAEFMGVKKLGFVATTDLDRKDFGLMWNKQMDKGGAIVGDKVTVRINGEANQEAPAKK
jgi:polyisoprenoid-binding protein YceI